MCNFKRNFLKCCVPWLRHEPLGAMTAVSYCKLIPRVPGANISEVPNSAEEFAHSAGGPQLELGWGPGRAKRARARPKKKKSKIIFLYDRPAGLASALRAPIKKSRKKIPLFLACNLEPKKREKKLVRELNSCTLATWGEGKMAKLVQTVQEALKKGILCETNDQVR